MVLALKDTADFPIPTKNIVDNDANFNYSTADSINAYDRTYLDIINANRTFFFPPANVMIERSTDSGSTWTEVPTSTIANDVRGKLFSDIETTVNIGTGNAALTQQLRITLKFPGTSWYCSLDRAFMRFNRAGHTTTVKIEASTYGAQSTYTTLVNDSTIDGWSGNNMYKFSERRAWGTNRTDHLYNIRFTFKYSSVNSSYISNQANIRKINMYGQSFWGTAGTPRSAGHLYNWDYLQNVTFPAKVTSTNFTAPRFTATGSTWPHIAGNGSALALSATGGWSAGTGAISLSATDFRPSTNENGNIDLGSSTGRWKNLYLSGTIGNGTYTYTLPSKSGTVALTSDTPPLPSNIAYIGPDATPGVDSKITTADIADGAVTSDKLDYSSYHYMKTDSKNFTFNTGWTFQDVPNWSMTFQAKTGEVYFVMAKSSYTSFGGSAVERGMRIEATGATVTALAKADYNSGTGMDMDTWAIITTTSTSVTVKAQVMNGSGSVSARIDAGLILAFKIG